MGVPAAVRKQEEAANAIIAGGGNDNDTTLNTDAVVPASPAETNIPAATQAAPVVVDPASPQVLAPQAGNTNTEIEALKHQISVLQGKYNAEIPRYATDLKNLRQENENLKSQLEAKESNVTVNAAMEALGDVFDEATLNAIKELIRAENAPVKTHLDSMQGDITTTQQQTTEQLDRTFRATLRTLAPNWEILNNDPGFKAFIGSNAKDGKALSQLVVECYQNFDAAGAAEIFNAYKPESATSPLDNQVMPGAGGGGATVDNTQDRPYTPDEIEQIYKDITKGKLSQKEVFDFETKLAQQL